MAKLKYFQYYVEGENEKHLLDTLKVLPGPKIVSGKVDVFNPMQNRFTDTMIVPLRQNTVVVLVFDTDKDDISILNENIIFLKKHSNIADVWCVLQCLTLEDELVRATNLHNIFDFYHVNSLADHKKKFNKEKSMARKLNELNFDLSKLWTAQPPGAYKEIQNCAEKIKLLK